MLLLTSHNQMNQIARALCRINRRKACNEVNEKFISISLIS
jgi:hypothetical protein